MPYRLNKGVYSVRCRRSRCPFHAQIEVDETIMGVTESDVKTEALKVVRDMARIKHDSIHGRDHQLQNPEIHMASGTVQLVGAGSTPTAQPNSWVRQFRKGDVILRKGEQATTVCEVIRGAAHPSQRRDHRYSLGDCFGVAALLPNHSRMVDVIADTDRTEIAFYQLTELNKHDPKKASRILSLVIEDTLRVIAELEQGSLVSTAS